MEQFPRTSTVMHYNVCISTVISALIRKTPWQQSNRTLVSLCAWVCVPACVCLWRQAVPLFACMSVHLYASVFVCLRVRGKACRGNLPISWPISIYMKTNYSCGRREVPRSRAKKNKRDAEERITMKRQNWMMSAEMQRSGSSEGPVCFDKTNSFLLEEPRLRHMKTLSCWEKMELMKPELSSPHS